MNLKIHVSNTFLCFNAFGNVGGGLKATVGVGTVLIPYFGVAITKGGGYKYHAERSISASIWCQYGNIRSGLECMALKVCANSLAVEMRSSNSDSDNLNCLNRGSMP